LVEFAPQLLQAPLQVTLADGQVQKSRVELFGATAQTVEQRHLVSSRGLSVGYPPRIDLGLAGHLAQDAPFPLEEFGLRVEAAHLVFQRLNPPLQFTHALGGRLGVKFAPHIHAKEPRAGNSPGGCPHRGGVQVQGQFRRLQPVTTRLQRHRAAARHSRAVGVDGDGSDSGFQFSHRVLLTSGIRFPPSSIFQPRHVRPRQRMTAQSSSVSIKVNIPCRWPRASL